MNTDPNFQEMSIQDMLRWYNAGAEAIVAAGGLSRPYKGFHDKPTAIKFCVAMASSLRALAEGQKAEARNGGPGLGRMQKQLGPGKAEELRQQVIKEQDAALAAAVRDRQETRVETQTETKKEKGNGRRGRAPAFGDDMHITILAEKNPKRAGTASHEAWEHYRTGMRVQTYVEKLGDRGYAMSCLRWDTAKGYIKVS